METIARTPLQLGNYIRQRRRELGLTQEKLAAKVGVRQRTVSHIETSAAARFDTVLRTLAALDLELVIRPRTKGTQEFVLRWSGDGGRSFREIVRQQWNFSSPDSIREVEEYRVEISAVTVVELVVVPDINQGAARASLKSLRVS